MADFMRHYSSQFGFLICSEDHARIHVEEAAGQRESVDVIRVDHLDRERHLRVRVSNQVLAEPIDVFGNDRIVDYQLRIPEQKQRAVAAFKLLNYHLIAAGDSFNDTAMLTEAHAGFLFRAPDNVKRQFPQFKAVETYGELGGFIKAAML